MSDHHNLRSTVAVGEIEHVHVLSADIGDLFMQEDYSDVQLLVESTRFHAHKVILACRSEYFRALLFGGMREANSIEIELKDTSAGAFKHLLRYIYTSKIDLTELKEEILLDVLGLAHRYGFLQLESSISDYLKAVLNIRNVCMIYDIASLYSLTSLGLTCCEYMDRNASDILHHDAFLQLSSSALQEVISRDSFCAPEIEVFQAVCKWAEKNPGEITPDIIYSVRLPLMTLDELLNIVRNCSLFKADSILDAIKTKNESRDIHLKYRGFLVPGENMATLRHGATVIRGEMKASLLDGDAANYDLDRGFSRHPIDDNDGKGIVVKLGTPCIINTIKLLLWDKDMRSYSYYIEVSMDDRDYVRVVDHTKFLCRSWQVLRFPSRVVRFVRICGTHNTVNRVFHLVSFECLYSRDNAALREGIVVPTENVATIEACASVIEGVSRSRNALLNGDVSNYDWDSGYTCHQLGSGAIVVQLAQPFDIGSMRLLLWDCDGRSYSFYIEVSGDQQRWTIVADRTKEACRSWQTIVFKERPVTFIKIVGTHNTANEVFHCVHFECPAPPAAVREQQLREQAKLAQGAETRDHSLPPGVAGPRDRQGLEPLLQSSTGAGGDEDGLAASPYNVQHLMHSLPPPAAAAISNMETRGPPRRSLSGSSLSSVASAHAGSFGRLTPPPAPPRLPSRTLVSESTREARNAHAQVETGSGWAAVTSDVAAQSTSHTFRSAVPPCAHSHFLNQGQGRGGITASSSSIPSVVPSLDAEDGFRHESSSRASDIVSDVTEEGAVGGDDDSGESSPREDAPAPPVRTTFDFNE